MSQTHDMNKHIAREKGKISKNISKLYPSHFPRFKREGPLDEANQNSQEFVLLLRTKNLSPANIEINFDAFFDTSMDLLPAADLAFSLGQQLYGAVKTRVDEWREKQEIYNSLFGFCLNADFITNKLPGGELKKGFWSVTDFYAAEQAVGSISAGFSEKPILGSHPQNIYQYGKSIFDKLERLINNNKDGALFPEFKGNIVSIGGPCNNRFSRWVMRARDKTGIERADPKLGLTYIDYPHLQFIFDFNVSKISQYATWDERRSEAKLKHLNYPIKKVDNSVIYTPEIYYKKNPKGAQKEIYKFSWDITRESGKDSLIDFVEREYGIDWVKDAKIDIANDGKRINAFTDTNSISITLNDENNKVFLEIDGDTTEEFIAKIENETQINVYKQFCEDRICKRDYGMIIKMRSFHKDGRSDGKWFLILAGCHGGGTLGAAKALGDVKILREIWDKVKVREFQAIIAVDVRSEEIVRDVDGENRTFIVDKPINVHLLEVEPIYYEPSKTENRVHFSNNNDPNS